jgi:hypothetical protein
VALSEGKQTRAILDDDEVSSDEDEPLQKRLRQPSGGRPTVRDEAVTTDKEAAVKWAVEKVAVKRNAEKAAVKKAVEERAAEENTVKAAAAEAAGAAEASPTPS